MTINSILKYIATLGFIGYIPFAPGTFGSAAGLLGVLLLKPGSTPLLLSAITVFLLGWAASHHAEKELGKDSGTIVIDELCGYLVSVLFIPHDTVFLVAAFVLFRFFDIAKPPPVRTVERRVSGGAGIMLDDVIAGLFANACVQGWRYFSA